MNMPLYPPLLLIVVTTKKNGGIVLNKVRIVQWIDRFFFKKKLSKIVSILQLSLCLLVAKQLFQQRDKDHRPSQQARP